MSNYLQIQKYIRKDEIMQRFEEILGNYQSSAFVSSVMIAVSQSDDLQDCTPKSIVSSALRAATLKLSCDPALGQAWMVPYKNKGIKEAQFQIGYKGLKHMAIRTGKYRFLDLHDVYEGHVITKQFPSGMHVRTGSKTSDAVIGYLLYFELLSGYAHSYYMTIEEIHAHAKRYAPGSYANKKSTWNTNTKAMERKTVMRLGLNDGGYFDPHDTMNMGSGVVINDLPEPEVVILDEWDNEIIEAVIEAGHAPDFDEVLAILEFSDLKKTTSLSSVLVWTYTYRAEMDKGTDKNEAKNIANKAYTDNLVAELGMTEGY